MYRTGNGLTVYEVERADRAASVDGRVVLKFTGGDGPFAVVMPEHGRVQLALHALSGHPDAANFAVGVEGLTLTDDVTGQLILTVHLPEDGVLNFVVPEAQQARLSEKLPRVAGRRPWPDMILGASFVALATLALAELWQVVVRT